MSSSPRGRRGAVPPAASSAVRTTARGGRSRRALTLLTLTLPTLALVGLASCGKKAPPLPPLRYVPQTTEDLSVAQQGRELVFEMAYPTQSTSGTALPELQRIELWALKRSAPEDGPPEPVDARQLGSGGELVVTLGPRDLDQATVGPRLVFRTPLPELEAAEAPEAAEMAPAETEPTRTESTESESTESEPTESESESEPTQTAPPRLGLLFAVRSVVSERDVSAFSNQAAIVPRPPPPPPAGLAVTPRADGIEVSWEPPAAPSGEDEEGTPVGFHVYRRDPRSRFQGRPLHTAAPDATRYLDADARFGQSYLYTVTTVVAQEPLIESAPGGAREIEYRDRFAPEPPRELVALAETGSVRLVWDASPSPDVAGHRVYRRDPEGAFRQVSEAAVTGLEYLDRGLPSGATFQYRVTAVDGEGNESEPSNEVTVEVR